MKRVSVCFGGLLQFWNQLMLSSTLWSYVKSKNIWDTICDQVLAINFKCKYRKHILGVFFSISSWCTGILSYWKSKLILFWKRSSHSCWQDVAGLDGKNSKHEKTKCLDIQNFILNFKNWEVSGPSRKMT